MQITPLRIVRNADALQSTLRLSRDREVSVVVPAMNEAKNFPRLLARIDKAMAGRSYEVIIVDDDSRDDTAEVCESLARKYPLRLVIRHRAADGLSGAVLHGMGISLGEKIVVMDADLQHPPEKIPALLAAIESGQADFALGSRYVEGGTTERDWGAFRRLNSRVATWLAKPFAGGTRDPMSGFFALSRETYRHASRLTPVGYKIALELMCKCRVRRVVEVPIHFADRVAGESKLSLRQQLRYLRHLARLYAFRYPRTMLLGKAAIGATGGLIFGQLTNPSLAVVMSVMAATSAIVLTRDRGAMLTERRLLEAEQVFRFDELEAKRRAA